jgi:hypothetical protein
MEMIEFDDMNDFPKLIPDKSICFDAKDELRRSPEMDYECSVTEYRDMVADEELADKYRIRLEPDTAVVMPNKDALKRRTSNNRLLWLSLAAAAAVAFVLTVTVPSDRPDVAPVYVTLPEPASSDTKTVAETNPKPATTTKPKPAITVNKKAAAKTKNPVSKKTVEISENKDTFNAVPHVSEHNGQSDNSQFEKLERIASIAVPVEMMNKEKTVFVYQPDVRQTIASRSIDRVADIVQKLSADVTETKNNMEKIIDGFKAPAILGRLSLDRGIDKEIDEWAKNNPDIPFNVFIDYDSDNQMKEIYDENGVLVRVVFFTNKSLKYKSDKTYRALRTKN